jgi:hypothetical protein
MDSTLYRTEAPANLHLEETSHQPETPDGVLVIAGYYALLGLGFVLFSLVTAVTAIPHTWRMAHADLYTFEGLVTPVILMMVGLVLFGLALGGWILACAFGLWRGRRSARRGTVLLSALMVGMCALAVPVLLFSYGWRDAILDMLLTVIGFIVLASGFSAFYLSRPAVRQAFEG